MDLTQFIDGAAILSAKGVICDRCFTVMIDPRIVTSDSHGMKCIHRLCQGCIDPANVCFIHGNNIVQIIEDVQAIKNMQGLAVKCPRFVLGCKMMDKFGELNGHKCDFEPISCKSCKKLLFRVDYESHLDRECEEIVVSCPLEFTGCNCPRMKRKEMKVHFANSMQKHFNLLFASYVSDCADSKKAARMKSEFDSVNCESAVDSKQWRLKLRKGARVDVCDKNVWCAGIVVDQSANQLLVHLLGQDPVSDFWINNDSQIISPAGSHVQILEQAQEISKSSEIKKNNAGLKLLIPKRGEEQAESDSNSSEFPAERNRRTPPVSPQRSVESPSANKFDKNLKTRQSEKKVIDIEVFDVTIRAPNIEAKTAEKPPCSIPKPFLIPLNQNLKTSPKTTLPSLPNRVESENSGISKANAVTEEKKEGSSRKTEARIPPAIRDILPSKPKPAEHSRSDSNLFKKDSPITPTSSNNTQLQSQKSSGALLKNNILESKIKDLNSLKTKNLDPVSANDKAQAVSSILSKLGAFEEKPKSPSPDPKKQQSAEKSNEFTRKKRSSSADRKSIIPQQAKSISPQSNYSKVDSVKSTQISRASIPPIPAPKFSKQK